MLADLGHNGGPPLGDEASEAEQIATIRRKLVAAMMKIVDADKPKAEGLKTVLRFLENEDRKAEEDRLRKPLPWVAQRAKELPFPVAE
jgi:hypothetical protein